MIEVAIIGLGPWGLCALERVIDVARAGPSTPVVVHVVEPAKPGGGMYSQDHPDYLVLNTPCGQHSMYPFPEMLGSDRLGMGFYEWASSRGYKWHGWRCDPTETGEPIGPDDFLPRRAMGDYLEWFYEVLCTEAPAHVSVVHHKTLSMDIERSEDGRELVQLADGTHLLVDHVILTTGHTAAAPKATMALTDGTAVVEGAGTAGVDRPYPMEPYMEATGPHQKVAIEGMGLVAMDVLTALTIGLGGHYTELPGGRLRYHRSGREPSVYMFSRSGYPYCAKSFGAADPMGDYRPAICTMEAVAALKAPGPDGKARQIDAREQLLPLVFAEMELRYYTCAAHLEAGRDAADGVRERLVLAWETGTWAAERDQVADQYGYFDASEHFFVGKGRTYADGDDYQAQVCGEVRQDAGEALVRGGASPVKASLETLRALRDTLRYAIEFKGLTLASHLDFVANMQSRFARLVAGPPVFRSQQLLALVDAGVLHMPFGPSPELTSLDDGRTLVTSTKLQHPYELVVDRVIRAHLDLPSVGRSGSPLLANLGRRGRVRPLDFDGTPAGSIDITTDFHPIGLDGQAERRLWVFGVLTEGARYFTLYIPSPKSRARAFVDAEACARVITGQANGAELRLGEVPSTASAGSFEERLSGARTGADRAFSVPSRVVVGAGRGPEAGDRSRPVRVALVNSMPDGAFEETERQFWGLVTDGAEPGAVVFDRYALPGIIRGPHAKGVIARHYRDLAELYASPPDALVITGAEPKKADLVEEMYWPALERLLRWASSAVGSALVSCLSAHAALWEFDDLSRRLLLDKCSGVFAQQLDTDHPLMAGVSQLAVPHSRYNEVPAADVVNAGYRVVASSASDGAWTVALGERGVCQFTLLQGHPEYQPLTLLREYRRDVRRYLLGSRGSYPHLPTSYLSPEGVEALERFYSDATWRVRDVALMDGFPFDAASRNVQASWEQPSRVLLGNWLSSVRQRAGLQSYTGAGA